MIPQLLRLGGCRESDGARQMQVLNSPKWSYWSCQRFFEISFRLGQLPDVAWFAPRQPDRWMAARAVAPSMWLVASTLGTRRLRRSATNRNNITNPDGACQLLWGQHTYAGLTLPCKPKHTWRIDELHNIRWSDSSTVQAAAFLPADWSMDMIWPPSCHASKSIQKGTFDFNLERHSDIPILYTFLFMYYILHIHRNTHTHWSIYYIIYMITIYIYIYITYIYIFYM